MTAKLRVSFNSPQSGFMSIGLKAGKASFVTAVASAPYDSVKDLIKGLSSLLGGADHVTIKWNCEPEEYDFDFRKLDGEAEFKIIRYPNHRRSKDTNESVFAFRAPLENICKSFWVSLNELYEDKDVDEFDKNWRRQFPVEEMSELTKAINLDRGK